MAHRYPSIVVAGHICVDIIPAWTQTVESISAVFRPGRLTEVGPAMVSTGGAVSNTGIALHRLGVPVRLMGKIGPDLTGSNRNDLFYLLENIIDPSAVIGRDYQLNNFLMSDGRLVSGIVVEDSPRVLVVQTATERLLLPKDEVEERKVANVSMMPEGIAEKLSFEELRDLIAFLRQK